VKEVRGSLRHLRREVAPPYWPILKKEYTWTVKPSPGPHPVRRSIPLGIIVRDILKYARTMREARRILSEGHIKVDGKVRKDYKFPVGLMDVLEVTTTGEAYRIVPHPQKFLTLLPIPKEEASFKLCRIEGKSNVKGGAFQLHLHDGRNLLVGAEEATKYTTYDVIKIRIPEQEIVEHVKFREGVLAVIIDGRNVGKAGKVKSIVRIFKKANALVTLEDNEGRETRTLLKYVFAVGSDKPLLEVIPRGS